MEYTSVINISSNKVDGPETLKVNKARGAFDAHIAVYRFVDADTNQAVCYAPSLELSGYGETKDKATSMLKNSINEYAKFIMELDRNSVLQELKSLGWIQKKYFSKQYTHPYVDQTGVLQNFNVAKDSLEKITLTAA